MVGLFFERAFLNLKNFESSSFFALLSNSPNQKISYKKLDQICDNLRLICFVWTPATEVSIRKLETTKVFSLRHLKLNLVGTETKCRIWMPGRQQPTFWSSSKDRQLGSLLHTGAIHIFIQCRQLFSNLNPFIY